MATSKQTDALQVPQETFQFKMRIDLSNIVMRTALCTRLSTRTDRFLCAEVPRRREPRRRWRCSASGSASSASRGGEFFAARRCGATPRPAQATSLPGLRCNDYQQYFPTIRRRTEERLRLNPTISPVEVGRGRRSDRALLHLYQMRGRARGDETKLRRVVRASCVVCECGVKYAGRNHYQHLESRAGSRRHRQPFIKGFASDHSVICRPSPNELEENDFIPAVCGTNRAEDLRIPIRGFF